MSNIICSRCYYSLIQRNDLKFIKLLFEVFRRKWLSLGLIFYVDKTKNSTVMKHYSISLRVFFYLIFFPVNIISFAQSGGLRTITEKELRYHLNFLGAPEFRGRETPSAELEIATLYLGNWAEMAGLKPVTEDGSFYQDVPLTVTSVFQPGTRILVSKGTGQHVFYFGKAFSGNFLTDGFYSGNVVFAGAGISEPETGWDDLKDLDLTGKVVVILDEQRPGNEYSSGFTITGRLNSRIADIRRKGAAAVLSVVNDERQKRLEQGVNIFDYIPTGRLGIVFDSQRTNFQVSAQQAVASDANRQNPPFERAEISHELASFLLGIPKEDIAEMFRMTRAGRQVAPLIIPDVNVRLEVEVESYRAVSRNVLALVEGSDPVLKNEYIVISGHHDARGIDDGEIIAGADDNGTATVALMEIGQALMTQRPRRSVILAWFTGEEQGMNGSHYFVNNCPVPVEKISACLNMDMIGRNDPDSLFLVGPATLSKQLDAAINRVNKRSGINFGFDYRYSDPAHPQRVYFRSDHYPFIRFGIPSVWFFSGFTPDYHTYRDTPEKVDYKKFLRTTKLVYLTAFEIGNMNELLKLDANPAVTARGSNNVRERSLFENVTR